MRIYKLELIYYIVCIAMCQIGQPIEKVCSNHSHKTQRRARPSYNRNLITINHIETVITPRNSLAKAGYGVNHDNLTKVICKSQPLLSSAKIATINSRSLAANRNVIKPLVSALDIDILCVRLGYASVMNLSRVILLRKVMHFFAKIDLTEWGEVWQFCVVLTLSQRG